MDSDCPTALACVCDKCKSPCDGTCGPNAHCTVLYHRAHCVCNEGFTGDPFSGCSRVVLCKHLLHKIIRIFVKKKQWKCAYDLSEKNNSLNLWIFFIRFPLFFCDIAWCFELLIELFCCMSNVHKDEPAEPCRDSPCGVNAVCEQRNDVGSCRCIPEYYGDPYIECRPECVSNSECPSNRACINNVCCDPCPGTCGELAFCNIVNHSPICSCLEGYVGNPLVACALPPGEKSFLERAFLRNFRKIDDMICFFLRLELS